MEVNNCVNLCLHNWTDQTLKLVYYKVVKNLRSSAAAGFMQSHNIMYNVIYATGVVTTDETPLDTSTVRSEVDSRYPAGSHGSVRGTCTCNHLHT